MFFFFVNTCLRCFGYFFLCFVLCFEEIVIDDDTRSVIELIFNFYNFHLAFFSREKRSELS